MSRINLFSTPVWTIKLNDDELNSNLFSIAGNYRVGTDYFEQNNESVMQLKNQIKSTLSDITTECGFSTNFKFTGRQNPMMPGKNNSPHHHPDCKLVAVYYVKVPEKSGDILLHDPRGSILWSDSQARTDVAWESHRPYHKITPTPGTLLVFPGYVIHSVETNLSNDIRISIAISTRFE